MSLPSPRSRSTSKPCERPGLVQRAGTREPRHVGEDVVRRVVGRDGQGAVPLLVPGSQAHRCARVAVHADRLRRDREHRVAAVEELAVVHADDVHPGRDVVPVHDQDAVAAGRVGWAECEEPCAVRHGSDRDRVPATVVGPLPCRARSRRWWRRPRRTTRPRRTRPRRDLAPRHRTPSRANLRQPARSPMRRSCLHLPESSRRASPSGDRLRQEPQTVRRGSDVAGNLCGILVR